MLRHRTAVGFGFGSIFGAVVALLIAGALMFPSSTVVYTSRQPIKLDNGAVLPPGTQFIHFRDMSEGFTVLTLYINVGRPEFEGFSSRTEDVRNLVLPYWVVNK